jgi:hypothetical protein
MLCAMSVHKKRRGIHEETGTLLLVCPRCLTIRD